MQFFKDYIIDYQSLSEGINTQELKVTGALFAIDEQSEIEDAALGGEIRIEKHHSFSKVTLDLSGTVTVACDRCLDPVDMEIEIPCEFLIKVSEFDAPEDEAGEVIYIKPADEKVDLSHYIYESVLLALPVSRSHQDSSQCNPEVLKFIAGTVEPNEQEDQE